MQTSNFEGVACDFVQQFPARSNTESMRAQRSICFLSAVPRFSPCHRSLCHLMYRNVSLRSNISTGSFLISLWQISPDLWCSISVQQPWTPYAGSDVLVYAVLSHGWLALVASRGVFRRGTLGKACPACPRRPGPGAPAALGGPAGPSAAPSNRAGYTGTISGRLAFPGPLCQQLPIHYGVNVDWEFWS